MQLSTSRYYETELYVRIISSSTGEVLYYAGGEGLNSGETAISAWNMAFEAAVKPLNRPKNR